MNDKPPPHATALPGGTAPLEQAVHYALQVTADVTAALLPLPTPCRHWDLSALLRHAADSLAALAEGFCTGSIGLSPGAGGHDEPRDPAALVRERGRELLAVVGSSPDHQGERGVTIGGCPMAAAVLIAAGTLEVAVHGWDIARACGRDEPIPEPLAGDLLKIAPLLVTAADRAPVFAAPLFAAPLFAAPLTPAPAAGASDRLAAFLGRSRPSTSRRYQSS